SLSPAELKATHSPSGDTAGREASFDGSVIAFGSSSTRSVSGSNTTRRRLDPKLACTYPMRRLSRAKVIWPAYDEGVRTAVGDPITLPEPSLMSTFQRLIPPPRSLEKYKYFPSGDHAGLQSVASS